MYKLQYVSNSLVSALQSLVKVSIYVQTSVHKATQNRLEREQQLNKTHHT